MIKTELKRWAVCSGEGERGTLEVKMATEAGIKRILKREQAGGDRWARATEMQDGETAQQADGRGLVTGDNISIR